MIREDRRGKKEQKEEGLEKEVIKEREREGGGEEGKREREERKERKDHDTFGTQAEIIQDIYGPPQNSSVFFHSRPTILELSELTMITVLAL